MRPGKSVKPWRDDNECGSGEYEKAYTGEIDNSFESDEYEKADTRDRPQLHCRLHWVRRQRRCRLSRQGAFLILPPRESHAKGAQVDLYKRRDGHFPEAA